MHATSSTCTSPKTPTCEVPSNGIVVLVTLRFRSTKSCYREAVNILHCALENGAGLHVNELSEVTTLSR